MAIDCRPATPTPITSTLAGGTVPAAVMNMGKNLARCSAAVSPALYPDTVACELRASMRLGPADAGEQVEAEDGDSLGGQRAQGVLGLRHAEEAQDGGALGQAATSAALGGVDPDDQTRPRDGRGDVGRHRGAGVRVGGVAERGLGAGARLHADLPARADQLLDHVGDEGHSALSGTGLRGDRQLHDRSV